MKMVTRNDFSIISPLFETSIKVRGFVNKKYLVKTFFHPANIFPLAIVDMDISLLLKIVSTIVIFCLFQKKKK